MARPPRQYSSEDHKRAYQVWYETRSWARASETLPGNPSNKIGTVKNWARPDFDCIAACPWHGWEELAAQQEQQFKARLLTPQENCGVDTLSLEEHNDNIGALQELFRTDIERLSHWEVLYSKAFYYCTGIILPCPHLRDANGEPCTEEYLREQYNQGIKPTNYETAVRAFSEIQKQVSKLAEQAGLRQRKARIDDGDSKLIEELTIEEMRRFQQLYENTDPKNRAILAKLFKSEQMAIETLSK